MLLMFELFERHGLNVPGNPDSPELLLCRAIAQHCGDPVGASEFVRALPRH
jgi:hypothetical protein